MFRSKRNGLDHTIWASTITTSWQRWCPLCICPFRLGTDKWPGRTCVHLSMQPKRMHIGWIARRNQPGAIHAHVILQIIWDQKVCMITCHRFLSPCTISVRFLDRSPLTTITLITVGWYWCPHGMMTDECCLWSIFLPLIDSLMLVRIITILLRDFGYYGLCSRSSCIRWGQWSRMGWCVIPGSSYVCPDLVRALVCSSILWVIGNRVSKKSKMNPAQITQLINAHPNTTPPTWYRTAQQYQLACTVRS